MSEDTESLIEERAYDTFGRQVSASHAESAETKERRSNFAKLSLLVAVGVSAIVLLYFTLSGSGPSSGASLSAAKSSSINKKGGTEESKESTAVQVSRPSYLKMDIYSINSHPPSQPAHQVLSPPKSKPLSLR